MTTLARPATAAERVRLARGVTVLVQDDIARILDLERGRFYALNATAAKLLCLAGELGPGEAVRRVAAEHGAEEARVRADWARLFGTLRGKGLVVAGAESRRAVPGRAALWALLALAWLSIRLLGWAGSVRLWQRGRRPAPYAWAEGMTAAVSRLDQAVRSAAATHLLNPQCKERALVAWHVLRNRWAMPAELVVGVLAFPFQAHAWVECGPWTVTDDRARCELYTPAARHL